MSFVTRAKFGKLHASFGRQDATTQKSDRGASRRETSSGGYAAMREEMKGSSPPTGRDLSESKKSQRGELIT